MTVVVLAAAAAVHLLVDPARLDRCFAGTGIAVGGVLIASVLNLLTVDTTAAAQAFLASPCSGRPPTYVRRRSSS